MVKHIGADRTDLSPNSGKARLGSIPSLAAKLTSLRASLVAALLHTLTDPGLRKAGVTTVTSYLIRLGEANAARDAFLAARTELIRKRARMIGFEGEIPHYISELAIVIFTSIKHTAEWYLASFKENDMASGMLAVHRVVLVYSCESYRVHRLGQCPTRVVRHSFQASSRWSDRPPRCTGFFNRNASTEQESEINFLDVFIRELTTLQTASPGQ